MKRLINEELKVDLKIPEIWKNIDVPTHEKVLTDIRCTISDCIVNEISNKIDNSIIQNIENGEYKREF